MPKFGSKLPARGDKLGDKLGDMVAIFFSLLSDWIIPIGPDEVSRRQMPSPLWNTRSSGPANPGEEMKSWSGENYLVIRGGYRRRQNEHIVTCAKAFGTCWYLDKST